ncbi:MULTISPECIES: NAD(P)-dependent oxidoreductase [Staphylococcus]|uniref:NAD(P)-dependent oxidoreductase n=1 Tax=Staphylococcus TaxID=1279 RepID=UPI00085C2552|nr:MULTISPECIES: NAD(P)-dependent oxidoreductase [Staphylococcus]MCS5431812.1 NAD(P)-dependent oxidoreductase [Staphylococcus aureus]QQV53071.1 NAD(P)-dependent oxidoreductase [Staphylococcus sp. 11-B-312]SCS92201.1 putative NADH-flavin reductase [Staphylococcus cohnii subsp. cohnii]
MRIGIIGATGKVGNLVLEEAIDRGHDVTAIVRNASKLSNSNINVLEKEIYDITAEDLKDLDVVVNAFGAPLGEEEAHVTAGRALIEALKGTDTRAIIVGGAGSLYVDKAQTTKLIDTPEFPEIFVPTAKGQGRNLQDLEATQGITWTFLSPSADFNAEGVRTGSYQSGKDNLLVNSNGNSYISYADFAIAILDEIENPQHKNDRFTVVGEEA